MRINITKQSFDDLSEIYSKIKHKYPGDHRRAVRSALSSEAYRLKGVTQAYIKSGGHGTWKARSPVSDNLSGKAFQAHPTKRLWKKNFRFVTKKGKKTRQYYPYLAKRAKKGADRKPLSNIWKALRYQKQWSNTHDEILFGFFAAKRLKWVPDIVEYHDTAHNIPVTNKMRRYFFAMGVPVKKTTSVIKIPARPSISTIYHSQKREIEKNLKTKYIRSLVRYFGNKGKSYEGIYQDKKPEYDVVW